MAPNVQVLGLPEDSMSLSSLGLLVGSQKSPLSFSFKKAGGEGGQSHYFECAWEGRGPLTIWRTSEETICIQHMAVANAHTMVERTLRAHTLKRRSWERKMQQNVSLLSTTQMADP